MKRRPIVKGVSGCEVCGWRAAATQAKGHWGIDEDGYNDESRAVIAVIPGELNPPRAVKTVEVESV